MLELLIHACAPIDGDAGRLAKVPADGEMTPIPPPAPVVKDPANVMFPPADSVDVALGV